MEEEIKDEDNPRDTYIRKILGVEDFKKLNDMLKTNTEINVIFDKIISKSVEDSSDAATNKTLAEKADYRLRHLLKHLRPDELVDGYVLPKS